MHNANYVAEEHIYKMDDVDQMIFDLKGILLDANLIDQHIELQHTEAMLESVETYSKL